MAGRDNDNPLKAENVFDVEDVLANFNHAFLKAARDLRATFEQPEWRDSPVIYTMPKMHVSMQVSLSYSKDRLKGVFFSKTTESAENAMVSTIEVDLVAVPRSTPPPSEIPEDTDRGGDAGEESLQCNGENAEKCYKGGGHGGRSLGQSGVVLAVFRVVKAGAFARSHSGES